MKSKRSTTGRGATGCASFLLMGCGLAGGGLIGCGNGAGGSGASQAGSGSDPGSVTSIGGPMLMGGTSTSAGPSCDSTVDCDEEQVCHPVAGACVEMGGECASHTDCEGSTYCDDTTSRCLPGLTGSPCDSDANCAGAECSGGVCACSGFTQSAEGIGGPLDIYFIFDRTASMGEDCEYEPGGAPSVDSKACYATHALPDYLINVAPATDTRLAFQFMSLAGESCDGSAYATPLVDLTTLPLPGDHQIVTSIVDETFEGGFGTEIEGALRGLAQYTSNNRTQGREMIGVLMTDGDPNGCDGDIGNLADIVAEHLAATGIRTFVIGMDGATEANLEQIASAGGAEPHDDFCGALDTPCHYWNVGDGSGDAIASALQAIVGQAAPLPCEFPIENIQAPDGMTLDYGKLNVTLTSEGMPTTIVQVPSGDDCPSDQPAWYYDDPPSPSSIQLCDVACDLASTAGMGARVTIIGGCEDTVVLR